MFGSTMAQQFSHIANFGNHAVVYWTFIPNILAFTVALFMLLYAGIKRLPVIYIVYMLGYIFISFAPSWLLSGARYIVVCVPLFIFLGHAVDKKVVHGVLILLAFLAGLVFMTREFLLGGPIF